MTVWATIAFALSDRTVRACQPATAQSGDGWIQSVRRQDRAATGTGVGRAPTGGSRTARWSPTSSATRAPPIWSPRTSYKDFQLHVEFWVERRRQQRHLHPLPGSEEDQRDKTCYEVNIFDQRKDPTYGTGAIVHFAEVNPMPKAGGKWNTYEITAKGRQITVVLNGQKTVELHNGTVRRRAVHAAVRRRRGEVPQGRGEKTLTVPIRCADHGPLPRSGGPCDFRAMPARQSRRAL